MTPPDAQPDRQPAGRPRALVASSCVTILQKRADFLGAARARRQGTPSFLLQARKRTADENGSGIRVGFTCSKKIGNAVVRNRAKRRLRAIARALIPVLGQTGWDYVLVGRPEATVNRPFQALLNDLETALKSIHAPRERKP